MKKSNWQDILKLNMDKNIHNKTVSDLNVNDKVRKDVLYSDKAISKGTDPKYSDTVYTVTQVNGTTISLSDGSRMKRTNLLKVPQETVSTPMNPIAIIKQRKLDKQQPKS
jgi:hypothetical protein